MTLRLELNDERLLGELINTLVQQGCLVDRTAPNACRIGYPGTWTPREAQLEIQFFLRAWQANHPNVNAVLT